MKDLYELFQTELLIEYSNCPDCDDELPSSEFCWNCSRINYLKICGKDDLWELKEIETTKIPKKYR